MKKMITIALITLAVAVAQAADFVSLNLYFNPGPALWHFTERINDYKNGDIAGESFGSVADSTVTTNWSNHSGNGWSTTLWDDGSQSSVGYIIAGNQGGAAGNAAYNNTAMKGGRANFVDPVIPATLTFTNLTANFSQGYDAIVYLGGHTAVEECSISDGTTTYYFDPLDTVLDATLIQVTSTTPGVYEEGNYVKFTGLTADTFTLTLGLVANNWAVIGGAQIIDAPVGPPPAKPALGLYIIH